jgi:hypothetical protein
MSRLFLAEAKEKGRAMAPLNVSPCDSNPLRLLPAFIVLMATAGANAPGVNLSLQRYQRMIASRTEAVGTKHIVSG